MIYMYVISLLEFCIPYIVDNLCFYEIFTITFHEILKLKKDRFGQARS